MMGIGRPEAAGVGDSETVGKCLLTIRMLPDAIHSETACIALPAGRLPIVPPQRAGRVIASSWEELSMSSNYHRDNPSDALISCCNLSGAGDRCIPALSMVKPA